MPKVTLTVNSIEDGMIPTQYGPQSANGYDFAFGIDPDARSAFNVRTSGALVPNPYVKFNGSKLTGYPLWILNSPKNNLTYVYCSDGKVLSYDTNFNAAGELAITTLAGGTGNGAAYYDNYLYFCTGTDVARYGPLNGVAALDLTYWTVTLGFPALGNPTISSGTLVNEPNHPMFAHLDNALYFGDFTDGYGKIHKIKTTKTTVEGDTDDGSDDDVLDLPNGFVPTSICNNGTDLMISAVHSSDTFSSSTLVNQNGSALFVWDTFSESFYRQVAVSDARITAVRNFNGVVYVFSGYAQGGMRVNSYSGGDSIKELFFLEDCYSPYQGGIDTYGDRIAFVGKRTFPTEIGVVYSFGSKDSRVKPALHCPVRCSASGSSPNGLSLKYVQQANGNLPRMIVGSGDTTGFIMDKYSGAAQQFLQWQKTFTVGREFVIREIRFAFDQQVGANMSITPTVWTDNYTESYSLSVINNANASGKSVYTFKRTELAIRGKHNFSLNLEWLGTASLAVIFPIEIVLDVNVANRRL